jgi:hypothetical protein
MARQKPGGDESGPAPTLGWIRRRTNIADLLDDGIENGSDIGTLHADTGDEPAGAEEEAALRTRDETLAVVRAEQAAVEAATTRRRSPYGLFLGVLIAAAGTWLIASPVDMRVLHAHSRYASFLEHVTPARSRLYGTAGLIGGLVLVGCALRRPS